MHALLNLKMQMFHTCNVHCKQQSLSFDVTICNTVGKSLNMLTVDCDFVRE